MSQATSTTDPVLAAPKVNLVSPRDPVIGRVVSSESCLRGKSASFVRHVAIDVSGTPLAGNFMAGQSFGVIAPGQDERGKPHKVRLYSIACPTWGEDGQGQIISTTPKRLIDERSPQKPGDDPDDHSLFIGVCSNYLCDIGPGTEVTLTGPAGKRFLLPADPAAHDYLFLATGTGIAPYRGMVQELLEHPDGPCRSEIHLVMGAPYTNDLLYDDLFRRLASEHENFHYHTAISREPRPGGKRGIYLDQLIDEQQDLFGPLLKRPRTLIYMCGLIGMQFGMYRVLVRHGLAEGYLTIKDDLAGVDPDEWTNEQMKRAIRHTKRCLVEVY